MQQQQQQQQFNKNYNENDNVCNKSLLILVARGNAIITELHRLIELVPSPFKNHNQISNNNHYNHEHQQPPVAQQFLDREKRFTLDDIICDFSYFKNPETFEAKIESNEILKKADENFCDNFIDILTRFYLTFESIQRFATDLNNFIIELEEETFVGQSLDGLLLETESRQLLCEAFFLLGYMLITTDQHFEGNLRERLIVSYYRYSSYKSSPGFAIDDTCHLMRSTGFRASQQQIYRTSTVVQHFRPDCYPESFFSRVGVNQSVVNLLIAKLQSNDIYNQTAFAFPHPDHRSTALSQQASMLYVLLYFCPNILTKQRSRMREITDKFFYDNWVISLYMGDMVNLVEAWEPYRAAKESLSQLVEIETIKSQINEYNLKFSRVHKHLQDYLREGWLDESSVLEHHVKILNQIREANVLIRWVLIHSHMQSNWQLRLTKTLQLLVTKSRPNLKVLYDFLQDLSELEKKFSNIYTKILDEKSEMMTKIKAEALDTTKELIDIFSDSKPMRWIQAGANLKLVELLVRFRSMIHEIDLSQSNSRDSIINLINELDLVQESYSDGKNLQVVQLFMDTKNSLMLILRYLSLSNEIKIMLQSIGDFSYAWKIVDETFTHHMQQIIKDNPLKVYRIESMFLKLASAFDTNLIRIQQVNAQADLISVSQYYSTKLLAYIRDVLHIIPATIFELVNSIVSIQTDSVMSEMPSKVSLDELREFALPDKRFQMLELTYKVSHYAESMLMMQDTTIGLIRINSKQLLEDGIRRELVKRMSDSIHTILGAVPSLDNQVNVYSTATSAGSQSQSATISQQQHLAKSLLNKLTRLNLVMKGYKKSFEYLQDFLFIYGMRIWQEELSRIVKFNVEQATEALLNEGTLQSSDGYQQSSLYQSTKAPIPTYSANPLKSSFLVKILDELSKITDPRLTIYDEQMSAWYDQRAQRDKLVIDLKVFELIGSSLCITGLNGLDQMCCAFLVLELQKLDALISSMANNAANGSSPLAAAEAALGQSKVLLESFLSLKDFPKSAEDNRQAGKIFSAALVKLAPFSEKLTSHLLRIGQLQAIRTNISCVLSTRCRYEARNLYNCLETLNASLMLTLRCGKKESSSQQKLELQSISVAKESIADYHQQQQQQPTENLSSSSTNLNNSNRLASSPGGGSSQAANNLSAATAAAVASSIGSEQMIGYERSDNGNVDETTTAAADDDGDDEDEDDNNNDNNWLAGCGEEDSQLIFELTNHLEWIGLSDPLSKLYTLTLHALSSSSEEYKLRQQLVTIDLIFLIVLDQCSKLNFSRKIACLVPKQSKSFYETTTNHIVDGQTLFYGLMTLINHYQPYLPTCSSSSVGVGPGSHSHSHSQSRSCSISAAGGGDDEANKAKLIFKMISKII